MIDDRSWHWINIEGDVLPMKAFSAVGLNNMDRGGVYVGMGSVESKITSSSIKGDIKRMKNDIKSGGE